MKVYFLTYNLDKNSTADYFIGLCNKLANNNKVLVITTKIRETNIPLNPHIEVYKWPTNSRKTFKDFIFLSRLIRMYKPNTMISIFGAVNMFSIVGYAHGVQNRIAWIRSLSSQFKQKRINVIRRTFIYKLSTQIIVNSQATKLDASSFYRIKNDKIVVLPNSVKDYSDQLKHTSTNEHKILYVGRLHPTKGIDILIKALSLLIAKKYDLFLEIIGEGYYEKDLHKICKENKLSKRIFFLGNKNKADVLKAYKSSFCTVIPSNSEAFGFTVIEAMSVGTCVVGANNTGIKEIIIHNKTGLLFETGNAEHLAKNIEFLINNRSRRDEIAIEGYKRYQNCYESGVAIERDFNFIKGL